MIILVGAIEIAKPVIYEGEKQTVYVSLSDNLGNPLTGRTIYGTLHYPNGSIMRENQVLEELGDYGLYKRELVIPIGLRPYGAYAMHITSTGISEVRTFEYVPEADLVVRDHVDTNQYLDWAFASVINSSQIHLYPTIVNQQPYALNLSQYYLWYNDYFLTIDSKLKEKFDTLNVYEEKTNPIMIDPINETTINQWNYYSDQCTLTRCVCNWWYNRACQV